MPSKTWKIESAQDETAWTHEYLADILERPCTSCLPPSKKKMGSVDLHWREIDPKIIFIESKGGTTDDRRLAEMILAGELEAHGYERAKFQFGSNTKTADWNDIMQKAKRLIQAGDVTLLRNGPSNVIAHVIGDHGEYTCEIGRDDPNSQAITTWQCECPWDQFAWQRTRQWKKYEGRPCAHVLAAYWKGLSTPLDEAGPATPGQAPFSPNVPGDIPGVQQQIPVPGGDGAFTQMPGEPSTVPEGPVTAPDPAMNMAPPTAPDILPPAPMQMEQLQLVPPGTAPVGQPLAPGQTVSVPGARPAGPFNQVQMPGTYSSADWEFVAAGEYQNGDMVRLKEAELGQMVGKSEAHGAGGWKEVPANSIGEVMGQDPTTGWVEVNFAGPQKDAGPMEPYHVQLFLEPEKLVAAPEVRKPGPFIGR